MKTIEITVHRSGQTTVVTKGFQGASCREATRLLEAALGQVTSEQLTAEFYQRVEAAQRQHESA